MLSKVTQTFGLPIQGSDVAVAWDHLYLFLYWLSVFFFILVVGGMIYLAVKYRKAPGRRTAYIVDHHGLEITWTVIPTILLMVIFAWGWSVYKQMIHAPANAYEIHVVGKQWLWNFQYDDGRILTNELYVPQGVPVKLIMSSEDVIHSFFVPDFRVKSDVVPGMYTSVWFEAKVPGAHQVFCTEYCGASHSLMLAKVYVLEPAKWEAWKRGHKVEVTGMTAMADGESKDSVAVSASAPAPAAKLENLSLPQQGMKVAEQKGCTACHSSNGEAKATGPTWKGVFEHEVELADGTKHTADENYIRESILMPTTKVVKGFTPVMPSYKSLLSETELNAVVAYIKSLK